MQNRNTNSISLSLSTNHLAAIMVPNFLQPPQITFTFSTNHLAANIIHHRPTTVCHPGISSPPRPALYGEATSCWYFPPNPSPLQFTFTWGTSGCLSGWAEASLGAASHGASFIVIQRLISLSCAQTEQKDRTNYYVMANF